MSARRIRVVVHGTVQGVGYRWAAQAEAQRLGLGGTIRNRFDGTVEAEIEGAPDAVDTMVAWLEHGPSTARVQRIEHTDLEARGESGMRITG